MDFVYSQIVQILQMALVAIINGLATFVGTIGRILPNPDPFPEIIENLTFGGGDAAPIAFYWLNKFVDITTVTYVIVTWFVIFGLGWIYQFLWNLIKVKNKG